MDSSDWDERYRSDDFVWKTDPNQFVVKEVSQLTAGRVLDVASGEGRNAVWLATRGWQATGVDFSSEGLIKARRLADAAGVSVDWIEDDVRTWRPAPQSFDLVLLAYAHFPEPERTTVHRSMATAVAPGGNFLVIAHDRSNLTNGYGGPQDPDLLFSVDDVVADVEGLGLEVEHASVVQREVQHPGGDAIALDALVHLRRR